MSQSRTRLLHRPGGLLRQMRGDMTQAAKRAMVRSGIVPSPLGIVLDVTDRCNFRCPTCSKWRGHPSRPELRLQDWEQVLPRIGAVPLLREAAVCGGEPFARTDIFDILRDNPRQLRRSEQARMIRGLSRRCTRLCRMLNNNL